MYRDSSAPHPILRLFSAEAAFPIVRISGVTTRVHWLTILMPLSFWAGFARWLDTESTALWTLVWTVALYTVIWVHEWGHVLAARHVGVPSRTITLWPLGGLAHLDRRAPSPGTEMFISVMGPATHLLWLVLAGAPYLYFVQGQRVETETWAFMLRGFVWLQIVMIGFNLLPFHPLDGSSILRGFLARRMHPNRATLYVAYLGMAGGAVIALTGLAAMVQSRTLDSFVGDMAWITTMLGVSGFLASMRLLKEARWGESPYEEAESPWAASIPQARWSGESDTDTAEAVLQATRTERAAGVKSERRQRPAESKSAPRRAEDERARLQNRVDELLDRMNEVGGMQGLSESEKKELADASDRLRR